MISQDAVAGYVLEEVLAHLLTRNGYRLLESPDQDSAVLRQAGHGLLVRGRGAEHQADALGELLAPVPFSLPIRLFLEAKNRRSKATLGDIRNAHGVISDVNEHYSAHAGSAAVVSQRHYHYRYALFSAAGFTRHAQSYALAHQIALIDLSGPTFEDLIDLVDEAAANVYQLVAAAGLRKFPLRRMRQMLRRALNATDSAPSERPTAASDEGHEESADVDLEMPESDRVGTAADAAEVLQMWTRAVAAKVVGSALGEPMLVGFPTAPFVLALQPENLSDVEAYAAAHPGQIDVQIRFEAGPGMSGDWVITAVDEPEAFRIHFNVPGALEQLLLAAPGSNTNMAPDRGSIRTSAISIFLEDRLLRMVYSLEAMPPGLDMSDPHEQPTNAGDSSFLRTRLGTERRPQPQRSRPVWQIIHPQADTDELVSWNEDALRQLLNALEAGQYVQGELIRYAARHGGEISREEVYRIAGYPPNRTLRGLTRPSNRITAGLILEGLLSEEVSYPFSPRYDGGVVATRFVVPQDVVSLLQA